MPSNKTSNKMPKFIPNFFRSSKRQEDQLLQRSQSYFQAKLAKDTFRNNYATCLVHRHFLQKEIPVEQEFKWLPRLQKLPVGSFLSFIDDSSNSRVEKKEVVMVLEEEKEDEVEETEEEKVVVVEEEEEEGKPKRINTSLTLLKHHEEQNHEEVEAVVLVQETYQSTNDDSHGTLLVQPTATLELVEDDEEEHSYINTVIALPTSEQVQKEECDITTAIDVHLANMQKYNIMTAKPRTPLAMAVKTLARALLWIILLVILVVTYKDTCKEDMQHSSKVPMNNTTQCLVDFFEQEGNLSIYQAYH